MKNQFKVYLLICASTIYLSCENSTENYLDGNPIQFSASKIYSNEYLKFEGDPKFEVINLDETSNFESLIEKMQLLSCEDKFTGLTYSLNDTIHYQYGVTICPTSNVTSCFFNRNTIRIKNDSLKNYRVSIDQYYPIESIAEQLKTMEHVDYIDTSGNPILKKVLIYLYVEEKYPIIKTKQILSEIENQFKLANLVMGEDYYRYLLIFEEENYFDISFPPPPPPPIFEAQENKGFKLN
ncbi:hypothetical protein [Flagellimonas zhangzhouensis]|uniref:Uncharacterized protein n=1 Tax=Flagellimonas zhangzhouensis TaxID=1073328 RepID=A0A1H2WWT2_9FLAO|nr:hypothetical protein [Allomuricauda zhangzhouensis]SDQ25623.1 hypothetical protein SAMN05216294_1097 [Allomuricauda zhangzhouensis]SDW85025.1 hypothetical protein SAMN04487892_2477 [Allomuricauda zhangzhouensis]